MGLSLLQNADARGYYENKTKGDYVIRLKALMTMAASAPTAPSRTHAPIPPDS